MSQDLTIDYVEFAAADIAAVKAFYTRVFDWKFTDYGPDYSSFSDGRMNGGFYRADGQSSTGNGAALVVLYAEDLERTQEAVVSAGGTVVKPTFSFPGGRRFHFADPHGNELAVWSDREPV